jgi:predicted solute-binding protein
MTIHSNSRKLSDFSVLIVKRIVFLALRMQKVAVVKAMCMSTKLMKILCAQLQAQTIYQLNLGHVPV